MHQKCKEMYFPATSLIYRCSRFQHRRKGWKVCPTNKFAYKFSVDKRLYPEEIQLHCVSEGNAKSVSTDVKNGTVLGTPTECETYGVGIQVKTERDSPKVIDVGYFCLREDKSIYQISSNRSYNGGIWEQPQLCENGKLLCGLKYETSSKWAILRYAQ